MSKPFVNQLFIALFTVVGVISVHLYAESESASFYFPSRIEVSKCDHMDVNNVCILIPSTYLPKKEFQEHIFALRL